MNLRKWTSGLLAAVAIGSSFAAPQQAFAVDRASISDENTGTYSLLRTSENVTQIKVDNAHVEQRGDDVVLVGAGGQEENISQELSDYPFVNVEKINDATAQVSISDKTAHALSQERINWKCALGAAGTGLMAGTAAATLGGEAAGAAQSCFD
ncbi:hypothetical protein [Corynebacterium gerontici]|uniref:Uncharacterized protein n=1 Tax=Corynebacterium gerontici TaxID=2079234 RepID=A0A3G6IXL2_9CORY|nr:hypothetical protein [Corynebacterium gerontici]AZA10376.1 hypothetical protein CGERO_00190 [Corynebacterium gerontici]